ncbi:MAG: thiol reductase thioredoxin [Streptosporangiales bacterium]|nr:thiol reductase thioredoxin [Streptosporangiales bacterium]
MVPGEVVVVTDGSYQDVVLGGELPVVLEYWADWCPPCHQLAPVLAELAAEWEGRVMVAKINTDENPLTTARNGVMANPTIQVYRSGELVKQIVGARSKSRLAREVTDALA